MSAGTVRSSRSQEILPAWGAGDSGSNPDGPIPIRGQYHFVAAAAAMRERKELSARELSEGQCLAIRSSIGCSNRMNRRSVISR